MVTCIPLSFKNKMCSDDCDAVLKYLFSFDGARNKKHNPFEEEKTMSLQSVHVAVF